MLIYISIAVRPSRDGDRTGQKRTSLVTGEIHERLSCPSRGRTRWDKTDKTELVQQRAQRHPLGNAGHCCPPVSPSRTDRTALSQAALQIRN
ncbi:MAG: hypothetical protein ACXVJD_09260 [Mucilaginibacter sp.]